VLTENGIAEEGPHDVLLGRNGVYAKLHSAQQLGLVG
jgi:ATP-binding cassette subfamily B protein